MIEIGATHSVECIVSSTNSASTMGSGYLDVFATPAMVAQMEAAAAGAVASMLSEGETTVGTVVNVSHIRATPMGDKIVATATLKGVDGSKLLFEVVAEDSLGVIGSGKHERAVVDVERFLNRLKRDR